MDKLSSRASECGCTEQRYLIGLGRNREGSPPEMMPEPKGQDFTRLGPGKKVRSRQESQVPMEQGSGDKVEREVRPDGVPGA